MKKFFSDFKKFISRGNIMDMAVGVIIGGAFSAIVTALTNKIIMPLIQALFALMGGSNGLESARTIIGKTVYLEGTTNVDWTNTIYIDWGAFITAIIDFLLIALVLFITLKLVMKSKGLLESASKNITKNKPTKEQKAVLKERGVNLKDKAAVQEALELLAQEEADKKAAEEASKPKVETEADILKEIRELMKAQLEASKPAKKAKSEDKAE